MAGILGYQDGKREAEMNRMKKQIDDQIAKNESIKISNFEQIATKFKEQNKINNMLMRRVQLLSSILEMNGININEVEKQIEAAQKNKVVEKEQNREAQYQREIIEPPETLQIESFNKAINESNWLIEFGDFNTYWYQVERLNEIAQRYKITYKCHYDEDRKIIDKGICIIKKFGQNINDNSDEEHDVTDAELDTVNLASSYLYATCSRTKVIKFTKANGDLTLRDLLEILNRSYKMQFNEADPHLKDKHDKQQLGSLRNKRFGGAYNVHPLYDSVKRSAPIAFKLVKK